MKKKFRCFSLIVIVITCLLCGCGNKTSSKNNVGKFMLDDLVVANTYYNATMGGGSGTNAINLQLLSPEEVKLEDIKVAIDCSATYEIKLREEKVEGLPYFVYQSYKNTDWKKMKELSDDDSKSLEFGKYRDKYIEEYKKLEKKGNIKHYVLTILFNPDSIKDDEEIQQVNIIYKGKKYKSDTGELKLRTIGLPSEYKSENDSLILKSIGKVDLYALPNNECELYVPDIEYECYDDITIKGFKIVSNDSAKVKEVSFVNREDNTDIRFNDSQKISKGQRGSISVILQDEKFRDKFMYYSNMNLIIEYEVNNKLCYQHIFLQFNTKLDTYEIYANTVDRVDVLSYYKDYYFYSYYDK